MVSWEKNSTNLEPSSLKDRRRKNVDAQLVFYAERLFGLSNIHRITDLLRKDNSLYATPP
jgi:hypothetical protein